MWKIWPSSTLKRGLLGGHRVNRLWEGHNGHEATIREHETVLGVGDQAMLHIGTVDPSPWEAGHEGDLKRLVFINGQVPYISKLFQIASKESYS